MPEEKHIAVLAITKKGIQTGLKIKDYFPEWRMFAPSKLKPDSDTTKSSSSSTEYISSDQVKSVEWFDKPTSAIMGKMFQSNDAIVCIFSLGAVFRLISPYIKDKKTDPAVLVIDDAARFVISALSGHLGGANELAEQVSSSIGAVPVITTAADVNKTIPVDLVGREFGWEIENDQNVTKTSAFMVNEERIGVFQDAGEKNWWQPRKELPKNVETYESMEELKNSGCKAYLVISDKAIEDKDILEKAVVYRPKTLVVGIGVHWATSSQKIIKSLEDTLQKYKLSPKSVAKFATLSKKERIKGLEEVASKLGASIEHYPKEELQSIPIPNPSEIVQSYEGTPSVAEAAAVKTARSLGKGDSNDTNTDKDGNTTMEKLVVEKQKFPPDLTLAVARILK